VSRRRRAALLLALATACGCADGSPRLEVVAAAEGDPPPAATRGAEIETRVEIRNAGGGRLHVSALVPDCACRADVLGSDVLAAGGRATVVTRCRAVPGAGGVRRVRLRTNDLEHPETVLAVRAPAASPAALAFGYVRIGTTAIRRVAVSQGVPVTRAPELAIEPGAVVDGVRTYRVRFTPRAPGVLWAALDTTPGAAPIVVTGVGFGAVAAFPAEVRMPSAIADDLPAVVLKRMEGAPFAVARVDFPADVAGEVETVVAGEQVRLLLRTLSDVPAADGPIRIHVAGDAAPIVIPVVRRPPPADGEAADSPRG
jgi:hypothetical protein